MVVNIFGQPLTINVNVISINPRFVPTGIVILREDNKTLAVKHLENGMTQFVLPPYALQPGVHKLVVYHAGDKNFAASTSPIFTKEVVK